MKKNIKVSKLDAARRQIDCAISLYFNESDPVSIHTLIAAAYTLLEDLNAKAGGTPMLSKEGLLKHIIPGKEKTFIAAVSSAENFFKHADRDPNSVFDFNPDQTETLVWDCCIKYSEMTGESSGQMSAFNVWFQTQHPEFFNYEQEKKQRVARASSILGRSGRRDFYTNFLEAWHTSLAHTGK